MPAASPEPPSKPPVIAELVLTGHHRYRARTGDVELILDGASRDGPNPVQALVLSLAGCMAMDVVHVLKKGRHDLRGLRASLVGTRADTEPRRFISIELHYDVTGEIAKEHVERAIALSKEKYCSVWHSLRPDIELAVVPVTFPPRPT